MQLNSTSAGVNKITYCVEIIHEFICTALHILLRQAVHGGLVYTTAADEEISRKAFMKTLEFL